MTVTSIKIGRKRDMKTRKKGGRKERKEDKIVREGRGWLDKILCWLQKLEKVFFSVCDGEREVHFLKNKSLREESIVS